MELNKQFTYTNVKIMKTMELLANFTIFFTTKKIWRLQDKWYAHKKNSEVEMSECPWNIDVKYNFSIISLS